MNFALKLILFALFTLLVESANWAVLVAGSDQFFNYRHQADVYRTYQILLKKGIPKSNIIVMATDDIANSTYNPFPGKVFNKPSYSRKAVDVYAGVQIDYRGNDVTPDVFKSILLGEKDKLQNRGTGRVLESNSQDNVFVYFSDHGAAGMVCFPREYLYADELLHVFHKMQGKFDKLVMYLEACEPGSMFVNLPENIKVYAVSAAGTNEPSWATYCEPDDVIEGKHIGSCLADLFTATFLDDLQKSEFNVESLASQYNKVKKLVTSSSVLQWGDKSFVGESISQFFGAKRAAQSLRTQVEEHSNGIFKKRIPYHIKLNFLSNLYHRNRTDHNLLQLQKQMKHVENSDNLFSEIQTNLSLVGNYDPKAIDYDCLKETVKLYESKCGKLSDYTFQYVRIFAENCQRHYPNMEAIKGIVNNHCEVQQTQLTQ